MGPIGLVRSLRRSPWGLAGVAAAAVLLVLTVLSVSSGIDLRSLSTEESRRESALDVSRDAALAFTTYNYQEIDTSFDRLRGAATDEFFGQFTKASAQLRPLIMKKKASSEGKILAVALEDDLDTDRASVIVAVDATVKNTDLPKGAIQRFRLRLNLKQVGGGWRVEQITPVV